VPVWRGGAISFLRTDPYFTVGTGGTHVHHRGAAGAAAVTTRDRHANTPTRAIIMHTRDRRSRARLSGAPRAASTCHQCATRDRYNLLSRRRSFRAARHRYFPLVMERTNPPTREIRCQMWVTTATGTGTAADERSMTGSVAPAPTSAPPAARP